MMKKSDGPAVHGQETQSGEHRAVFSLVRPVFFVGFMGAGKTTVARKVARLCGLTSIDMDSYLESSEGKKVSDIFTEVGEEGFRSIEGAVLEELAGAKPQLISCGGGVILKPENRHMLKTRGYVVYLKVSADEAADRIIDASTRPMFKNIETARITNQTRMPLYEEVADIAIDTAGKSIHDIAGEVKSALQKEGVLCQQPK